MKIVLCVLTRNEAACVKEMLPGILKIKSGNTCDDVVVIDGGSTDGTVELFSEKNIRVINQENRGRGDAFQQAFLQIKADAYVFFSPDGNENIDDVVKFRKYIAAGADLVIASRMMALSHNEEDDHFFKFRKWANLGFNFFANALFWRKKPYITDSINGFRGITCEAAKTLSLDANDYTIEYQMTIRAMSKKMNIIEFPTIEGNRIAGETGATSLKTGILFSIRLISEFWRYLVKKGSVNQNEQTDV